MLTLHEVRLNPVFKFFYKAPSFIRNAYLMLVLSFILLVVYLVYFSVSEASYKSIVKLLHGLNSNTFNYLESKVDTLLHDKTIPTLMSKESPD